MHNRRILFLWSIFAGLLLALGGWPGPASPPVINAAADVGYPDFSYQYTGVVTPTGEKPQSKLWYNDGRWWASMFNRTSHTHRIYWLNLANQTWNDTAVDLDTRAQTKADVLWDNAAQKLYVVSGGGSDPSGSGTTVAYDAWFMRYSYNPQTHSYSRDFNPVVVRTGGGETVVLAKDTTGMLWVTFTQGNQVYVNHSTTADNTWATPFVIPGARTLDPDDISSIVAYRDKNGSSVGVLWSNHVSPASMYFAAHKDGDPPATWQPIESIYSEQCAADDHIDLKAVQADPSGAIFAAVKTSFGDNGCGHANTDPLLRLVVRRPDNTWEWATFGTIADAHTRPVLLLDTTNRRVYMFATAPTSCGAIYMKSTSMDTLDFSGQPGLGEPFIQSNTYTCVNNATTTKQTVDANTGLVVMASDENTPWYLHNYRDLGGAFPRLVFQNTPAGGQAGSPFTTQPIVVAQDSAGHTNSAFNGLVTLSIDPSSGTAGAALVGTVSVQAVAGIATFSGLAISKAGASYRLSASASGQTGVESAMFDVDRTSQTISFGSLPSRQYGDPSFTLSANASSGLPVSFSATGNCAVSGATLAITGAGSCAVRASQAGNANYGPAPDVIQSFSIGKANQAISFAPLPHKHFGDPPFTISAVASSGLAVSFSATGDCTVVGNLVTITGKNLCAIRASQAGSVNYNPAPDVTEYLNDKTLVNIPIASAG